MQESDFFRLNPEAVALLLELAATPSRDEPLLVVEFGNELSKTAQARGHRVIEVNGSLGHEHQVQAIITDGPYSGAVISPAFNVEIDTPRAPDDWLGQKRWFLEEYLIAHAWSRLVSGARLVALVSTSLLTGVQRKAARRAILDHGLRLVATLPNDQFWVVTHNADTHIVLSERRDSPVPALTLVDALLKPSLPSSEAFSSWLEGKPYPGIDLQPVTITSDHLSVGDRLDPAFYDPTYLELHAPKGYAEYRLGDIADITAGVRLSNYTDRLITRVEADSVPFVQVRHLRDGTLDQPYWLRAKSAERLATKRALPGDILVSASGTIGKVALVSEEYADGVLFDTSVRRLRFTEKNISPQAVFEFLRSELGQQQFRRLTSGTVIAHLAIAHLAQVRIFLPNAPAAEPAEEVPAPTTPPIPTQAQTLIQALEEQVLTVLRRVDDTEGDAWRQRIATYLQKLAAELIPKPLSDVVRQEFPAPLAIAYRRYHMAQHNPYEQLDRMINLVEACAYFAFYVLLADYSKADWRDSVTLPKDAEDALKPRATFDDRIRFLRAMTDLARTQRLNLFVSELADSEIDVYVDRFRTRLRNPVAHSAPGSEAYVRDLIEQHRGDLETMLNRLRFFRDYSMCRVRNHYFQRGKWHYQCELYRGEEYDVNIQELQLPDVAQDGPLIAAERDHLVLLSPEYDSLDLWPYYQLHFSDVTCRESHLCFVKHFTAIDDTLHGESVRSGIELNVPGFVDYFRIATRRPARHT